MRHPLLDRILSRITDLHSERQTLKTEIAELQESVEKQRAQFDKVNAEKEADDAHIVELEKSLEELKEVSKKQLAAEEADDEAELDEIAKAAEVEETKAEDKKEEEGAPLTPKEADEITAKVTSSPITETNVADPIVSKEDEEWTKLVEEERKKDEAAKKTNDEAEGF